MAPFKTLKVAERYNGIPVPEDKPIIPEIHNRLFPHTNMEYFKQQLLRSEEITGISREILEKDYWISLCLWALTMNGFGVHLKGGTSLLKGFNLISRISEDIDLSVNSLSGPAADYLELLPTLPTNPLKHLQRLKWFLIAHKVLVNNIPGCKIRYATETDPFYDPLHQNGTYWITYKSVLNSLHNDNNPDKNKFSKHIMLEFSSQKVVFPPLLEDKAIHSHLVIPRTISPLLKLSSQSASEFFWPECKLSCLNPTITLLQKVFDCLIYRFPRELPPANLQQQPKKPMKKKLNQMQVADLFNTKAYFDSRNVRHFEDCARIIQGLQSQSIIIENVDNEENIDLLGWPFKTAADVVYNPKLLLQTLSTHGGIRGKSLPSDNAIRAALKYVSPDTPGVDYELKKKWELYSLCDSTRTQFNWGEKIPLEECSRIILNWLENVQLLGGKNYVL